MDDRTVGTSTTRRRLLGAAGGALAGAGMLSGAGGATDGAADANQQSTDTPTPTSTPTPPDPVWPLFHLNPFNSGYQPNGRGPTSQAGARWAHGDGGRYTTTPIVTEDEVFAADEADGVVRAVDVNSGATRWETEIETANSFMTIQDRVLYVPAAGSRTQFVALDAGDGSRLWSTGLAGTGRGVVADGTNLYVGTSAGVSKVSGLSESVSWEYEDATLVDTTIAFSGDSVFAADSTTGKVVNLSVSDGSENWTNIVGDGATGSPTVAGTEVVVPFDGQVAAFRTDSGRQVWSTEIPAGSSLVSADGDLYGTTTGGDVFSLDGANGAELWRTSAVTGSNPPVFVGNLLYVAGTGGTVAAVDPRDGSTVWQTDIGAGIGANPAVYGGELYVADEAGRIAGLAAGASGGYGTPTPTDTPTPPATTATASPTPTDSPTRTRTPTPSDPGGGTEETDTGGGILQSPTATEQPEGGVDLPLIGGAVAAVVAAVGGGLWWRNKQGEEYDRLG